MRWLLAHLIAVCVPFAVPFERQEGRIAASINNLARSLYDIVSRQEGNVVFSPLGVNLVLAMLCQDPEQGAAKDCLAATSNSSNVEGYRSLFDSLSNTPNVTVSISNKAAVHATGALKMSFRSRVQEVFGADVEPADFSAALAKATKEANRWAGDKSGGRIPKVFAEEELQNALLVLTSSLYFKGDWLQKFKAGYTTTDPFYTDLENRTDVAMMHQTARFAYKDDRQLDAEVLVIPFANAHFEMVVILPRDKNGTVDLEEKLACVALGDIADGAETRRVRVSLPKFRFEQTLDLADALAEIGLGEVFNSTNNLSGIMDDTDLHISSTVQKVFIHMHENGTEAASISAIRGTESTLNLPSSPPVEFKANHPFVFLLTHLMNGDPALRHILFYGRIQRPAD